MTSRRQPGEGGISAYQTKSGPRYRVHWEEPVDANDPKAGKKQRSKSGFLDKKTAATALRSILSEIDTGRYVSPNELTVGPYAATWLGTKRVSPSTMAMYKRYVRLHIEPHIGSMPLQDVRASTLAALYRKLEDTGRRSKAHTGEPLSLNTVLKVHVLIGAILQSAVDDQLIALNPARHPRANPPTAREVRAAKPEMLPWSRMELRSFLRATRRNQDDHLRFAWVVFGYSGMRRGELLGLRWSDIDFTNSTIAVRRARVEVRELGEESRVVEGLTKSGKARVIHLGTAAMDALRQQRSELAKINLGMAARDKPVFIEHDGTQYTPDLMLKRFKRAVADYNRSASPLDRVPVIRLHDLRHTHATILLEQGVHPRVVQERLGHQSITVTMETYSHVMPSSQKGAAEALDEQDARDDREAAQVDDAHSDEG